MYIFVCNQSFVYIFVCSQSENQQFKTSSCLWLHVLCMLNKATLAVHISKPMRGSHRTSNNDRKTNVPIVLAIILMLL